MEQSLSKLQDKVESNIHFPSLQLLIKLKELEFETFPLSNVIILDTKGTIFNWSWE